MIVFCIRKKGTEDFFPSYVGRGQTHIDFVHWAIRPPRIWYKKRAAKGWLTTYCKGPLVKDMEWESQDEFGSGFYYSKGPKPDPHMETKRNRDDYEIVPMQLTIYNPAST